MYVKDRTTDKLVDELAESVASSYWQPRYGVIANEDCVEEDQEYDDDLGDANNQLSTTEHLAVIGWRNERV
jgi:hypothetical protein